MSTNSRNKQIPVVLITGYLGSGKTTLLNHILSNREGTRYAVIVNDIGEVNIDAALIQKGGVVGGSGNDDLVALQNGCICCSLRMDLVNQLTDLISTERFDAIVIEASGICEPAPIAQTICSIPAMGEEYTRHGTPVLSSIVTVVDALRMRDEFGCGSILTSHHHAKPGQPDDDIQALVIDQIEFCSVVLINKISEITTDEARKLMEVVTTLQPKARIIECDYADVDPRLLFDADGVDFAKVATSAGWISQLESTPTEEEEEEAHHPGEHHHHHHHHNEDEEHDECHEHHEHHGHGPECHCCECESHDHEHAHHHLHHGGIDTFVYYRRAPFDIHKLDRFLSTQWPAEVIRTKGVVYFAHNRDMSYLFEQAGRQKKLTEAGYWYATAQPDELAALMEQEPGLRRDWDEEYGDRMIKLVFIGRHLDTETLTRNLDATLAK